MKTNPVLLAACALMFAAPVQAGIVIVNHDEWTLSSSAVNGPSFGVNIANYFAGGSGGSFLIYSNRSLKYDQNLKPANVKSITCAYFFVTEQAISATC